MEVATGDHVTFVGKYQRVVGNGVGLDHQYIGGLAELGQTRTHDLWLAAQGVRVLHLAAVLMRSRHFTAVTKQVAVTGGGVDLTTLATGFMDTGIKRRTRTQYGFNGQATNRHGGGE
ncbi:hypothetical protein D3C78_1243500 [compost metagenome]